MRFGLHCSLLLLLLCLQPHCDLHILCVRLLDVVCYITGYIMSQVLSYIMSCTLSCVICIGPNTEPCPACPRCPLFITQDVAVCSRPTDTQTERQRDRQVKINTHDRHRYAVRVLLGLNGWYTGLETRLFQVSRDRLRLTSYAVLLTRSSDSSSCLLGLSICVCPSCSVLQPAEEAAAAPGRLPTRGHVLSECPMRLQTPKINDY